MHFLQLTGCCLGLLAASLAYSGTSDAPLARGSSALEARFEAQVQPSQLLVYAPRRMTGYGAKTLPGVREATEDEHSSAVERYAQFTGAALDQYALRLEECTQTIPAGVEVH
jgi:hypothetical protein